MPCDTFNPPRSELRESIRCRDCGKLADEHGAYVFAPKIEPTPDPTGGECMGCEADIPKGALCYEFDNWRYHSLACCHAAIREQCKPRPLTRRLPFPPTHGTDEYD